MTTKTIVTLLAVCDTSFPSSVGSIQGRTGFICEQFFFKSVFMYAHYNRKFVCYGGRGGYFSGRMFFAKVLFSCYLVGFESLGILPLLKMVCNVWPCFCMYFFLTNVSYWAVTAFEFPESERFFICDGSARKRKQISIWGPNQLAIPFYCCSFSKLFVFKSSFEPSALSLC